MNMKQKSGMRWCTLGTVKIGLAGSNSGPIGHVFVGSPKRKTTQRIHALVRSRPTEEKRTHRPPRRAMSTSTARCEVSLTIDSF
jgi:hypothetical protein